MLLLNNCIQQHYLSPAKGAHLIYLSMTLIGRVLKLPSFPLLFRQVIEPESKQHVNTSYTNLISISQNLNDMSIPPTHIQLVV